MRQDGKVKLINVMTTIQAQQVELGAYKLELQELSAVARPLADMVEPPVDGADPHPPVERLQDVPGKIAGCVQGMAKSVSK